MKTEENKKQVELTDEQLDNVAGGHQHKLAARNCWKDSFLYK